jgi:hypothetical protein
MTLTEGSFSETYAEARTKFLTEAEREAREIVSVQNPLRGPLGERLFMDFAWFGAEEARQVMLLSSGTHGIEGYCGSGIQIASLREGFHRNAGQDLAIVFIHAVNPHGFAWGRRCNEDGVDVMRNFVDFSGSLPENPVYDELVDAIVPAAWSGPAREAADQRILDYVRENGFEELKQNIPTGQYKYWYAPFFGGVAPTWSNRVYRDFVRTRLRGRKAVCQIDYHTGLGDYAAGQLIGFHRQGSAGLEIAPQWWGERFVTVYTEETVAYHVSGGMLDALEAELPETTVVAAAYEFGTVPENEVLTALRSDHWLYAHGELDTPLADMVRTEMRSAFFPEQEDWMTAVTELGQSAQQDALEGLGRL